MLCIDGTNTVNNETYVSHVEISNFVVFVGNSTKMKINIYSSSRRYMSVIIEIFAEER